MRLWILLVVILGLYYGCADASGNRRISIIIPCHPSHVGHLYNLLRLYEEQSILPDEVVISLSESGRVLHAVVAKLKQEKWAYPVKLILSQEKLFAGQNRNVACSHAIGDILITQDADDFPHPQRVEVIKYFFNTYNLDFLMHQYKYLSPGESLPVWDYYPDMNQVRYIIPKNFQQAWDAGITNGNIAVSRKVFEKLKWPANQIGEDVNFNKNLFGLFSKGVVVLAPLLLYRSYLSSYGRGILKNCDRDKKYILKVVHNDEVACMGNFIF